MGLRETINRSHTWGLTTAALLILAAGFLVWRQSGAATSDPGRSGTKAWFSTDDGTTWFADDATKIPPFKKDGKDAYRVYVWRDKDGKEYVSHLERYTSAAQRAITAARDGGAGGPEGQVVDPTAAVTATGAIEIKRPKQTTWTSADDPRAGEVWSGPPPGAQLVHPE
jgi:hypothetical protein